METPEYAEYEPKEPLMILNIPPPAFSPGAMGAQSSSIVSHNGSGVSQGSYQKAVYA